MSDKSLSIDASPRSRSVAAPGVIGVDDLRDVGVGQFAMNAVDERAHFPRIDEERLLAPVAEASRFRQYRRALLLRQEPEADGNLRAVEELAGQGDHAVHEVGLDEGAADVAFAGLVGGHAAIGEDEAGHAVRARGDG